MLSELDRVIAEHACARLAVGYALHLDSRNIDAFAALWGADGVWHNSRGPLRGSDVIRQYLEGQTGVTLGRHVCSNIQIDLSDAEHATGTSYFTFYAAGDPTATAPATIHAPQFLGRYLDEYVKTAAGWKFASRRLELTFKFG